MWFGSDRKYSDFSRNTAVRASQRGAASGGPSVPEETYHMKAAGETAGYGFAKTILEEAARASREVSWFVEVSRRRPLITKRIIPITTAEHPTPGARPAYSVLSNSRLVRTFGFELSDWRAQLQRAFSTGYEVNRLACPENRLTANLNSPKRVH